MKKINFIFLFAGIVLLASCTKKQNELGEVNGAKTNVVEFSALKGVPKFADINLENTQFTIKTQALGELKFDLTHDDNFLINNRPAMFTGQVTVGRSGVIGTAYLYQGLGGIQIGMEIPDSEKHKVEMYQIRNFTTMYDVCDLVDDKSENAKVTVYTRSVIKDLNDIDLPSESLSQVLLEKNSDYELINLSAIEIIYNSLHPQSSRINCSDEQTAEANADNSKRDSYKTQFVDFNFYVLKNNDFGTYSYNEFVDKSGQTVKCFKHVDQKYSKSKFNQIYFSCNYKVMNSVTYGNSTLVWHDDAWTFLQRWTAHNNVINSNLNDYAAQNDVNMLCTGNHWNGYLGMATIGGFSDRNKNKCIVSVLNGASGYAAVHELSHVMDARHQNNVFNFNGEEVQDLMRTQYVVSKSVCYHLDGPNRSRIQGFLKGY